MNWRLGFAAALVSLTFSGAASAAVLANLQGSIQYSRPGSTSGFVPAANGTELRPGDLVMAGNGRAVLVYSATCSIEILPNTSVDVQSQSPCNPPGAISDPRTLGTIAAGTVAVGAGVGAYFLFKKDGASQE